MSLPNGFGSTSFAEDGTPEKEPTKKCIMGLPCDNYNTIGNCKYHKWTHFHEEAWVAIRIIAIFGAIILTLVGVVEYDWLYNTVPTREMLDNKDCLFLTEYIADKDYQYGYAEHRYKWLCVEAVQHNLVD